MKIRTGWPYCTTPRREERRDNKICFLDAKTKRTTKFMGALNGGGGGQMDDILNIYKTYHDAASNFSDPIRRLTPSPYSSLPMGATKFGVDTNCHWSSVSFFWERVEGRKSNWLLPEKETNEWTKERFILSREPNGTEKSVEIWNLRGKDGIR
ncbi:hypothetical protein B9Z55_014424 [Caenorhabditis nigoni]|uniref:Uncharacterized protein n=1 Tax=Caenorhabditis nigoni TaxID=1611254 RepID=A0A2G5U6N0_9PELO|nr:hypothetical protein B9Z55_014424 [Caenorhabditis nigoni]